VWPVEEWYQCCDFKFVQTVDLFREQRVNLRGLCVPRTNRVNKQLRDICIRAETIVVWIRIEGQL
jgi:hypothetical protein